MQQSASRRLSPACRETACAVSRCAHLEKPVALRTFPARAFFRCSRASQRQCFRILSRHPNRQPASRRRHPRSRLRRRVSQADNLHRYRSKPPTCAARHRDRRYLACEAQLLAQPALATFANSSSKPGCSPASMITTSTPCNWRKPKTNSEPAGPGPPPGASREAGRRFISAA